ncbi:MarR family winged helix-turn-helix transcriptional regulator [Martelella mediterranea]|uniref:MarR family winged helix-turn-helix transcriptional regulator n=1 Tax=uncultured Martelella sp. TaxID=392331 RepID=UPI000D07A186|nr:MarR family transcriptional regulator [uncultured Martelella sp.]
MTDDDDLTFLPRIDNQLCFAVYATEHAFARAYKPLLSQLGLTYPQYLVMMALWEHRTLSVNAIGARLGLDSGTLSPLLKRLETTGYIARRRAQDDERRVEITLTPRGREIKSDAETIARSIAAKTGCTAEEARDLHARLNTLRQNLLAAEGEQSG